MCKSLNLTASHFKKIDFKKDMAVENSHQVREDGFSKDSTRNPQIAAYLKLDSSCLVLPLCLSLVNRLSKAASLDKKI
jgi:hypothetical protein